MAVNHVQALDSYPMDGWRSSRTHPLARRETLTGPQVRILHHPHMACGGRLGLWHQESAGTAAMTRI